jgi:hypothetical protein
LFADRAANSFIFAIACIISALTAMRVSQRNTRVWATGGLGENPRETLKKRVGFYGFNK